MPSIVIVGLQWGDEGKGKVVDLLAPAFDGVVRFQGGHNAGHTVKFEDRHFALHLVPSGIVHDGKACVLGNGVVISPTALLEELDGLEQAGIDARGRLFLSDRAQVVLPFHAAIDAVREDALGDDKIGTTSRGIGPTYEMKMARQGLRLIDIVSHDFTERVSRHLDRYRLELGDATDALFEETLGEWPEWRYRLAPMVVDTTELLLGWLDEGRNLLFEGAQGALLDVDHGTYPFVTSSSSATGGACTGTGVPPTRIDGAIGVLKAYTTRVGEGPFPTELLDEAGESIRARGNEFGTTTGRPRRCGWLDLPAARRAVRINGTEAIALTKLDVLDSLAEIPICVGYTLKGKPIEGLPADAGDYGRVEPVLETLPGWQQETVGLGSYEALPQAARDYIERIERFVGAEIALVSTGPRREETILRKHRFFGELSPA